MRTSPLVLAAGLLLATAGANAADEYAALIKANKWNEAERAVAAKLAAEPRNGAALAAKVDLLLSLGQEARFEEAIGAGEACVAGNPQRSQCHEALGDALAAKALAGSMWSAMRYAGKIRDSYRRAVELDPRNFDARIKLLQFYVQAPAIAGGGKDKARDLVAETARGNAEAGKLLRARLDATEDGYAAAESLALSAAPGADESLQQAQRNTLAGIAYRYLNDKKYGEAERIFRDLDKREPDDAGVLFGLARVQQEQGRCAQAVPLYEKAGALQARGSIWFRMGQCLQTLQDKPRAIAAYEKALAARPALPKQQRQQAAEQIKALRG